MAVEVLMPRQGQSVESCVIIEWKKKEGDPVKKGEILCEVETDKAVFGVESPQDGVLLSILYPQGADVSVLTPIAYVGKAGELVSPPAESHPVKDKGVSPSAVSPPAGLVSDGSQMESAPSIPSAGGKIRISPRALRLAQKEGIDPHGLAGTGPRGRIIERDVRKALETRGKTMAGTAAQGAAVSPVVDKEETVLRTAGVGQPSMPRRSSMVGDQQTETRGEEVSLSGTRKVIARRMMESLQNHAQFTLHALADARALLQWRKRFKESKEDLGYRGITLNDLVLYAVARTLPQFPELNAHWLKDRVCRFSEVHLAVAVDTPKGLLVPVIRNANALSLLALSKEAKRLAEECGEGKIAMDSLQGGTFTVTNLGSLGITYFTPILNSPQAGILGVGAVHLHPVAEGEEVKFYPHLPLSLTVDHQAVDGAPASRFLKALTENIANIDLLLAGP